tara:strand:+ start:4238 stop:4501 length:264 start_codon:yes stop_codon:yes gene_type:complete
MSWLSAAGALVGSAIGGPFGAPIGAGLGAMVEDTGDGEATPAHKAAIAKIQQDKTAQLSEEERLKREQFQGQGRFQFQQTPGGYSEW